MILGVIPARKGSVGIPGKNMVDLGGRPLLDYTFATAERCRLLNRVVLSTDMEDAIVWVKQRYPRIEVPFTRPAHLAQSASTSAEVVLHAVEHFEAIGNAVDAVVLLQPTCPFRESEEVDRAIEVFEAEKLTSLVGVSRVWHHPSDFVCGDTEDPRKLQFIFRRKDWQRRQDFPEVWFVTGALYICRVEFLREAGNFLDENTRLFPMHEETMVDIDSPFDLAIARGLVAIGAVGPTGRGRRLSQFGAQLP